MFGFKKKKAVSDLVAPVSGQMTALEHVNDPVFASKAMGEGFGIVPAAETLTVTSPVAGKVTTVFKTQHAIGLTTAEGLDVLIHIGIETVTLEGAPFTTLVEEGAQVEVGTPLSTVDFKAIMDAGLDPVVLVLVTNSDDKVAQLELTASAAEQNAVVAQATLKN